MKHLLLLLTLFCSLSTFAQEKKLLASCCESKESKSFGRCTGSAYCTACTNCRYCKYCNSGGSCGVCAPSYTPPVKTKKKTTRKSYSSSSTPSYNSPSSYTYGTYLIVTSETLNLREDAGTDYDIIEALVKGDKLKFISYEGDWIKVEVVESGNTGYVYYKYVRLYVFKQIWTLVFKN